jgi:hypothetical protein
MDCTQFEYKRVCDYTSYSFFSIDIELHDVSSKLRNCTFLVGPLISPSSVFTDYYGPTSGYTADYPWDGDTASLYEARAVTLGYTGYVGIFVDTPHWITSIRYYPRTNYGARMVGGVFESCIGEDTNCTALHEIVDTPPTGLWTEVVVSPPAAGQHFRLRRDASHGHFNLAEIEFYGWAVDTAGTNYMSTPCMLSAISAISLGILLLLTPPLLLAPLLFQL